MLHRRRPVRVRPVFSWRTLLFEVLTIVIGVLIALGVNEARQRWSERKLARQAAVALHAELGQNCAQLTFAQRYHRLIGPRVDSVLAANPAARSLSEVPGATRGIGPALVTTTAYEAAEATGALGLLDFELVVGLGQVYTLQDLYKQAVQGTFTLFSQGEMSLARMRQGTIPMVEIEREVASAACSAHRALGRRFSLPVDSTAAVGADSLSASVTR